MEGPFCSHNNVIRDTVPALHGAVRDVWFCKDCLKSFLPAPLPEPFVPLDKSLRDKVIKAAKAHIQHSYPPVEAYDLERWRTLQRAVEALLAAEGEE